MHGTEVTDIVPSTRVLLGAAIVLFILSAAVTVTRPVTGEVARYPVEAHLVDGAENISLGVSVDTDRIDFGQIPVRGITVEKSVSVANSESRLIQVRVQRYGNVSPYIDVSSDTFALSNGDTQQIDIKLQTSNASVPGFYSGGIVVEEHTPFWRWLWQTN